MISPFTPSGTRVICIDDEPTEKYVVPGFVYGVGLDGLTAGVSYTVKEIVKCDFDQTGLVAELVEISRPDRRVPGYSLRRFRRAELPSCLTEILTAVPIAPREREKVSR